ncbi:PD40 domain-containing protein [Polaribacter pectinis]|uniref:PD40 domain-containing protein n=1 Tax=Polaribacter pectinis TaxID=2738844 RepID=A0A7G9L9C6_9FLAO|nr:PD40 domain-containing protein [Polaribacter pectinis]QNM85225.1 PD40 domain-containing protein [Polaribacter pectinis]
MKFRILYILVFALTVSACKNNKKENADAKSGETKKWEGGLIYPEEVHFKTMQQITFGGDNAEAYWSFNDKQIIFQSNNKNWGVNCDQMFLMNVGETFKDSIPPMISTGLGRTTCAYFLPDNKSYVYGSTHLGGKECPPSPLRREGKYVWPIYESYDIFVADLKGNITKQLTTEPGYDAEATVSPKGDKIVFTSMRTGDLELFTMNIDGSDVKQITDQLGYDGGAFFSPDGTKLIFRSSRPKTEEAIKEYQDLLKEGLVQPTEMELYICNADGSELRQLTDLGNANWSPFFHPSGKKILFSSNFEAERGFPFNLYMIDLDGKNLERVTHGETFDAFPVFSNDGKKLIFSSNRNNGGGHDTNLFIAEWQD